MSRVEDEEPVGDAGALAQANFFFQHCCAAAVCVRTLGDGQVLRVLCETHEDFAVIFTDGRSELVSVKHREGRTWTIAALVNERVLGGLLDRWRHLGEEPRCRFMTNAETASGRDEATGLRDCCKRGDAAGLAAWAARLAPRLHVDAATCERFLGALTFDRRASRDHIVPVEAVWLRRVLRDLQIPDVDADRYFTLLAEAVGRVSRAVGQVELLTSDFIADATRRRRLAARTIDREFVAAVLLDGASKRSPLLGGDASEYPATVMVRKLKAGGLPPTNVENAKRLRAAWTDYEQRWRTELPGGDAEWSDLRARVLQIAARAERRVDTSQPYGTAMLDILESELEPSQLAHQSIFAGDGSLLLGLAFQLTDECSIWWARRA